MSKSFLNIKRHNNSTIDTNENDSFFSSLKMINTKLENRSKKDQSHNNSNSSNSSKNFRKITVFKKKERITIKTDSLSEFQSFVYCFNCLFYIQKNKKYYLFENKSIEIFFSNSDFHILYDAEMPKEFDEKTFNAIHNIPKRKECEKISDFCFFPKYFFSLPDHKYYYTSLWSPERILKFYRLSNKNYIYMRKEFDKCSNPKILKLYGPKGTGKSTFVYAFFEIISTIKFNFDKIDKNILNKKELKIKELKLNEQNNIKIKKYVKPIENLYEVNNDINISGDSNDLNLSNENKINEKNISINIIEEENDKLESTKKDNIKNELLENIYYTKEFNSYFNNEDSYFLSSIYVDLDKERDPKLSENNKKYFELELMLLFKTFKFYQYLLIYLNGEKKPNIFDRLKQIIQFMLEVKNNRNYFIIIDHISEKEQNEINDLEQYSKKDPFCYIIELPLIITKTEKLNLLKDLYLSENDELESYDSKDKISYIKRNSDYGIIYTTNYYTPEFIDNDNDDKVYEENFGKNIYFYCLWKYDENKIKIDDYIKKISEEITKLFKENYNNDENELIFNIRTIIDLIEQKKEITNIYFLSNLPLEYFILTNNDNKYKIEYSFPLIDNIIKNLNISSSLQLLKSRNFISYFDNFVKGGIIEKVFAEKIEQNYKKILNNDLKIINIEKLLDNQIRDYFTYKEVEIILKENKRFMEIYNNKDNITNKNIIFNQIQNAKHYDLAIKLYNKGNNYIFAQVSYHKPNEELSELLYWLWIDINYMINKITYLCGEEKENINGIYVFFILMDLNSYKIINKTEIEDEIINKNIKYNSNVIKKLKQYNIDCILLDSEGNLKQNNEIIEEIPLKFNLVEQFQIKINDLKIKKKDLEKKIKEDIKKIFNDKKLLLVNYIPFHQKKEGFIMVNIFDESKLNYYEIEGLKEKEFYDMNGNAINNDTVFAIEKKNSKKWKMNVLIKLKK